MSQALYRIGRFAARRPWVVIGTWLLVSIAVIGASAGAGRELEDSFEVPGLDSQNAIDLLSAAQSDRAGLTAQVVMTPLDDEASFFESVEAQTALAEIEAEAMQLPNVWRRRSPVSRWPLGPSRRLPQAPFRPMGGSPCCDSNTR